MTTDTKAIITKVITQNEYELQGTVNYSLVSEPRFIVAILRKGTRQYLFKFVVSNDVQTINRFYHETRVIQLLNQSDLAEFIPKLVKVSAFDGEHRWYIREYYPGETGGDVAHHFAIHPKYLIDDFLSEVLRYFQRKWEFGVSREALREIPIRRSSELPGYTAAEFHWQEEHWGSRIATMAADYLQDDIPAIIESVEVFNHNDFYPANIVFDQQGVIKIIDWELSGYNYPLFDAALFYILTWKNLDWQQRFKAKIIDRFSEWGSGQLDDALDHIVDRYFKHALLGWATRLMKHAHYQSENGRQSRNQNLFDAAEEFKSVLVKTVAGELE